MWVKYLLGKKNSLRKLYVQISQKAAFTGGDLVDQPAVMAKPLTNVLTKMFWNIWCFSGVWFLFCSFLFYSTYDKVFGAVSQMQRSYVHHTEVYIKRFDEVKCNRSLPGLHSGIVSVLSPKWWKWNNCIIKQLVTPFRNQQLEECLIIVTCFNTVARKVSGCDFSHIWGSCYRSSFTSIPKMEHRHPGGAELPHLFLFCWKYYISAGETAARKDTLRKGRKQKQTDKEYIW